MHGRRGSMPDLSALPGTRRVSAPGGQLTSRHGLSRCCRSCCFGARHPVAGVAAASAGRWEILRLAVPPVAARRFARRLSVYSGRPRGRRILTPLHFQPIAHPGACGKTRVVPHNRRPGPESTDMGSRNACVVADVWVARGRRTADRTRGAGAGTRRGGAGVRYRRVTIEAIRERATCRGRHDRHRRGDRGRDAAARRDQPGKVASIRVNHTVLVPAPMVASDLRSELMP